MNAMTQMRMTRLGNGVYFPQETKAQESTIAELERGLSYPVQGVAVQDGKFLCPVWTDGDDYFVITRDGKTPSI